MSRSMAISAPRSMMPPPATPSTPMHSRNAAAAAAHLPSHSHAQHIMTPAHPSSVFATHGVFGASAAGGRGLMPPPPPRTPMQPPAAAAAAASSAHYPTHPPPPPATPAAMLQPMQPPPTPAPHHHHHGNNLSTPVKAHFNNNAQSQSGFQTPAPSRPGANLTVAVGPSPGTAVATAAAGSALSAMSEAESIKLMAALNQFVLVALQQQTAVCVAAASTGVRAADAKNYTTLLAQLQAQHADPLALSRWYAALSKSVASFHAQHHYELLQLLYGFSYCDASSLRNVEVLINLLVAMCVGGNQIHALAPALKTLVSSFIATNVPFATISAASVSPALYGRPGDASLPEMSLGQSASPAAAAVAAAAQFASGGHELPSMDSIHDLVHSALTRLMQLLPSSPTVLFPLLVESFPHKRNDVTLQLVYVKNLLRVSEYAGSLRDRILTTIIERMIHIDVEIVHRVEGDEDEDEEEEEEEFDGGMVDDGESPLVDESELMFAMGNSGELQQPLTIVVPKKLTESHVMANKLDSLMCLMFEYLNLIRIAGESSAKSGTPKATSTPQTPGGLMAHATNTSSLHSASTSIGDSSDLCDEVFSSLLRVFERSILRTHNSRFLQFLLFYYCSFKHVYAETFLKYLMERGFEVQTSAVERQNSALYIASFVARASFLRHASAIVAFEMLLKWTHAYTEYHITTSQAAMAAALQNSYAKASPSTTPMAVPEVGPLEASQHAVFYRMCQAVFYIFCYRQSSFRDMLEQNPEILHSLRLDALIFSPLNPLRFISQTVIDEFLRVNAELGHIVQCDELVQRNHRLNQSSRVGAGGANRHQPSNGESSGGGIIGPDGSSSATTNATRFDPNDIFFPFDPYQLKHSSAYIEDLYILYQQEEDEEVESESSDEDDADAASRMDDDDEAGSHPDASSSRLSKPIRIGGRLHSASPQTHSPELDASVSSMSASFSDHLSVDDSAVLGTSSGVGMSFEMDRGLHLPPAVLTLPRKKGARNSSRPMRNRRTVGAASSDDDSDHGLMLSDQDLSFSPNSPSFAPLEDSPPIRPKRR